MAKKKVTVMVTAFRDGFQSVYGARVLTRDFIPALEAAVHAGFDYFEIGGGARFQSAYFYCNEDAFASMDACRKAAPKANLQTLARGVNVVALDSQSSDMIKLHAEMFKKHGVTTIRNFDALNDVDNLDYSGRCIHGAGLKHEVCVSLMALPPHLKGAHDAAFYIKTLKGIIKADIPFDTVCFKDASGTTTPRVVYDTIKEARKVLPADIAIHYHTHETAGIGLACYQAALDAGATMIDLSLAPVSGGTAQTDAIVMWHALRGTDYDLGFDYEKVLEAEAVFKDCMKDYFVPPEALAVEPLIPFCPLPGGALTANTQMLRDNGIMDKFPQVIAGMEEVVAKGGFGTSVTPVSQFYFQQSFNNVLYGPWKKIAPGYGQMVLGYFGRTPAEPDPEIVKIASEQLKLPVTKESPRALNDKDPKKGRAAALKLLQAAKLPETEENIFIAGACGDKGIQFLEGKGTLGIRKNEPAKPAAAKADGKPKGYTVSVNNRNYSILVEGGMATVNGVQYQFSVAEGAAAAPVAVAAAPRPSAPAAAPAAAPAPRPAATAAAPVAGGTQVSAPMPGAVVRIVTSVGAQVAAGDTLLVLEAMKMENEIKAPRGGRVAQIAVTQGTQASAGQLLVVIE
jgi:pyruvate carboxylase subunit B